MKKQCCSNCKYLKMCKVREEIKKAEDIVCVGYDTDIVIRVRASEEETYCSNYKEDNHRYSTPPKEKKEYSKDYKLKDLQDAYVKEEKQQDKIRKELEDCRETCLVDTILSLLYGYTEDNQCPELLILNPRTYKALSAEVWKNDKARLSSDDDENVYFNSVFGKIKIVLDRDVDVDTIILGLEGEDKDE